jgi:hypothetical protein
MENIAKIGIKGIVEMQLKDELGNSKKIFQGNKFWDAIHRAFNLDVRLPFITGNWTFKGVMYNEIKTAGLSEAMKLLGGVSADPISHMAIGEGTGGTTTLNDEIADGGGERVAVTPTSETTTSAGDTCQSVNTFTFTDAFAVTEEGLLNNASAGDLIAYRTFSAINVASGDSLQITHKIVATTA